jgi:hypothetical protein
MLAGLMENNYDSMWTFEQFFDHSSDICDLTFINLLNLDQIVGKKSLKTCLKNTTYLKRLSATLKVQVFIQEIFHDLDRIALCCLTPFVLGNEDFFTSDSRQKFLQNFRIVPSLFI